MDWRLTSEDIDRVENGWCNYDLNLAQATRMVQWSEEQCTEHHRPYKGAYSSINYVIRKNCDRCWTQLREDLGMEKNK